MVKSRTLILIWIVFAAALLAAPEFLIGLFGHVAVGLAGRAGLVDVGLLDRLTADGFVLAGWLGAGFVQFVPVALMWLAGLCAGVWLASKFRLGRWVPLVLVVATGVGAWRTITGAMRVEDPTVQFARQEMLDEIHTRPGPVFINPSGVLDFAPLAPEIVGSVPFKERYERLASVSRWREAERGEPSASVLFAGRVAEARGMIEHLLASPDWRLAFVNGAGLLFVRDRGPDFVPRAPAEIGTGLPVEQRARLMAATALRYEDAGLRTAARGLSNSAMDLAPEDPQVLAAAASIAASQGRWERARSLAERALKVDPNSSSARFLLASAELQVGSPAKASEEAARLVRRSPRDVQALWLHARAARAARDPMSEIASLERLLALSEPGTVEAGRIQIFLGQAWAQRGFPDQSLGAYRAALATPLTEAESSEVRQAIETVESNRLPTGG
ncbi:MAG: tetratricopeptide repeat protein [Terrimicrobiaceae bacterium]|nr:tetratricopeptide repeat protein [Terrimicrobiaceae bacterium]